MALDNHVRRFHPALLGFLTFTSIISLAIAAWLQSRYNAHHNYPTISLRDRNTFTLFTAVWTIVFNLIFMALFLRASTRGSILGSVASHFVIFFLTWIFWLAAASSLTAPLSGVNCSHAGFTYCDQLMADMAFAWINWILTTIFLFALLALGIRSVRNGNGYRGGLVSGETY
ncbi:hypothetical protein PENSPDRAFT_609966 [Peniophora sp. CONT]|nr:hypothetical protein PENSPDRAFT_609966 [Peniophora sp. CONT]